MSKHDFILDGMRWSYSSVNTYHSCPQAFRIHYLDAMRGISNAFAEWGTYMHSLLERYFTGELELFEMVSEYQKGYEENVVSEFPENAYCDLGQRYFDAGIDYLSQFAGIPEEFKVVAVEQKVKLMIDGYPFIGIIDLVLEKDGEYYIVDHKSKSRFKSAAEQAAYFRQLYLYAIYIREKYGKWPVSLMFNMVRANERKEIPFREQDAAAARDWFVETIRKIYTEEEFVSAPNRVRAELRALRDSFRRGDMTQKTYLAEKRKLDRKLDGMSFYCEELCGSRAICPDCDKAH